MNLKNQNATHFESNVQVYTYKLYMCKLLNILDKFN